MKSAAFIFFLVALTSCQDLNSNSSDRTKYGPVTLTETDPNFAKAYNIIQTRCVSCHSSNIHSPWASYKDNEAWKDSGIVQPQISGNSLFIIRIINYGSSSSNMPQGGTALPAEEYDHLIKWIDEIP